MRNVIAFLNMKGGVCKTSLCKEIGLYLAERCRKSILIIDVDPQSNCTQSFLERYNIITSELIKNDLNIPSIQKIFSPSAGRLEDPKIEEIILELSEKLHIVPGELRTIFMERETASGAAEQKLYNFIDEYKIKEKYDYVLIDCPPTYSFYTIAALLASDLYLIPVTPDAYSLLGVDLLQEVIEHLKSNYRLNFQNHPLDNLGVIFTKIPKRVSSGIKSNIEQIKEAYEEKDVPFFENSYLKAEKVATSKLSTFILDRQDESLKNNIKKISEEFMDKVGKFNE